MTTTITKTQHSTYELWELAMWVHLLRKEPKSDRNDALINQYVIMIRKQIPIDTQLNNLGYDAYFEMLHRNEITLDPVIKILQDLEKTV